MRFVRELMMGGNNIEDLGEGNQNPRFTGQGKKAIEELGFDIHSICAIVRQLREDGLLPHVVAMKFEELSETRLLYTIMPMVMSPQTNWKYKVGFTAEKTNEVFDFFDLNKLNSVPNVMDYMGLPGGTVVFHNTDGLIVNTELRVNEGFAHLSEWEEIAWEKIFPGVIVVPEAQPKAVVAPAKPAATAPAPKQEVLVPLPTIPNFIQGPARERLFKLADMADDGTNTLSTRRVAQETYLKALEALTVSHKAEQEAMEALGIKSLEPNVVEIS